MAHSRWVVNASPLILLGKVEQIQSVPKLLAQSSFWIMSEKLTAKGDQKTL